MKQWIVVSSLIIVCALGFFGCSKKEAGVDPAPIEKSFATAEPSTKATADKVVVEIRGKNYAAATAELQKLAAHGKLTPEQESAIKDVLKQLENEIKAVADKAVKEGTKAVDDIKKTLGQ